MNDIKKKLTPKNFKSSYLFVALGLIAGLIMVLSGFLGGTKKENITNTDIRSNLSQTDTEVYIEQQEQKLSDIISKIEGAGDVSVMITLDASYEYIYAEKKNSKVINSKNSGSDSYTEEKQSDMIFYNNVKSEESPLLIKELQPSIKGVAVICGSLSDAGVRLKIINLVSTVLNLPTNRIFVDGALK